ncbi:MAG: toll/interleukin-1 receptor domain-containing protein [Pyrinomonadaceae bacterium]
MQVFISHAETDGSLAGKLAAGLEEAGLKVWYDRREILPGANWAEETAQALKESEAMVVLLTPAALRSTQVRREIQYALGGENYSHRLIPVFVGSADKTSHENFPWIFASLPFVRLPTRGRLDKVVKHIAQVLLERAA